MTSWTRPSGSIYASTTTPPVLSILNESDTIDYLNRIGLTQVELLKEPPSLDLLSILLKAHQLTVPYDTSSLHIPEEDWTDQKYGSDPIRKRIELGKGDGMTLGKGNFDRVVKSRRGGYCYALNTVFASLLRSFQFQVSEVGARVYLHRGKDPKEAGWLWSPTTHEVLIVDWEGSDERYQVDAGFGGGGCPYPIRLVDGATTPSLSKTESFILRSEALPTDTHIYRDKVPGWTLYRRVAPLNQFIHDPHNVDNGPGHWTPCYHFLLQTICPGDINMANYFNETNPKAPFVQFFVVSILLPSGSRKTLAYGPPPVDMSTGQPQEGLQPGELPKAKLYTKEGIRGEEKNVRWIEFETSKIRTILKEEFGFQAHQKTIQ